jgi:hypothetical protein
MRDFMVTLLSGCESIGAAKLRVLKSSLEMDELKDKRNSAGH